MSKNKTLYAIILILSLTSNLWLGYLMTSSSSKPAAKTTKQSTVSETVKLYSNGKVVEQWEATGPGQWRDGTYTFRVGKGAFPKEVRIHGTFSVVRTN